MTTLQPTHKEIEIVDAPRFASFTEAADSVEGPYREAHPNATFQRREYIDGRSGYVIVTTYGEEEGRVILRNELTEIRKGQPILRIEMSWLWSGK